MAVSTLLANNINLSDAWNAAASGTPDAVAWCKAVQATSGAIDVSAVTVTGSTSGSATLAGGQVKIVKAFSGTANDILVYIIYILNDVLTTLVGNLSAAVTYTSATSSSEACVGFALAAATDHVILDTSGSVSTVSAATPWAENTLTVSSGSVQLFAYGSDTTSTNLNSVGGGTPGFYTVRRNVNITGCRLGAGDYTYAAGGSRGMVAVPAVADTGAIVVASFKEGSLTPLATPQQIFSGVRRVFVNVDINQN